MSEHGKRPGILRARSSHPSFRHPGFWHPSFWHSVGLLLGAVRQRARGRRRRQRELLHQRTAGKGRDWSGLAVLLTIGLTSFANIGAALLIRGLVATGEPPSALDIASQVQLHRQIQQDLFPPPTPPAFRDQAMQDEFRRITGNPERHAPPALDQAQTDPALILALTNPGAPPPGTGLAAMLGSLGLMLWSVMLTLQGEGLDLDVQRRRHPMWEWLFSHPVPPGAVFLAEMLAPLAANPVYWSAPLLPGILYGDTYGAGPGLLAIGLVGVPLTVAAACLGKALEIAVMLRAQPRSRGALIGLMSWLGYALMMLLIVCAFNVDKTAAVLTPPLAPLAGLPWPWLGLFLGQQPDGSYSYLAGVLTCAGLAGLVIAGATGLSVRAARIGLAGATAIPSPSRRRPHARFGADPLRRKELLWFRRDRSALVQVILVPLTAAGLQIFNMRGLLEQATSGWNRLCGVGVLVGTFFLATIGPKSLHSEGSALWLALTWPRGLESLLRAKARLWAWLSCLVVGAVLGLAAILFPAAIGPIALVGLGWLVFARSMADKAVTLATVTAASGEPGAVPANRQWATQLGTLTFAIGVMSRQWQLALVGIVYSTITAAAMWQNFRARLPFLYDPWSERLPPAPTLMHAMIAISCLVEGGAVLTGAGLAIAGRDHAASAAPLAYGTAAAAVALLTVRFLRRRGVRQIAIWRWQDPTTSPPLARPGARRLMLSLLAGLGLGAALGLAALAYLAVLRHLPAAAPLLRQADPQSALLPSLHRSLLVMAVLIAPPAEEFLFRGLLYRALDREWGGVRAVLGSGVFFAMYHPPTSWLPVAALGCANALLFRRTGRLAPAVLSHMVYNAIVLW